MLSRMLPRMNISKWFRRETLTDEEIRFFVDGVTAGTFPDYQASALLMAILLRGMTAEETARALDISVATVGREQRLAEAWLHRELTRPA